MMAVLLAISDSTTALIVSSLSAAVSVVGTVIGAVLTYFLAKIKAQGEAAKLAAEHAAVQREELAATQKAGLQKVADQVEEVHKATNSMKDQLVLKTEQEALQRGGIQERARADAAAEAMPPVTTPDMLVVDPKGKTIATITPAEETIVPRTPVIPIRKPGLFHDESGIVPPKGKG